MAAEPLIIAHRGASGLAPENTLPAFAAAIEADADGVEFDVHLTADGHAVVHHDYRISEEWGRLEREWPGGPNPAIRGMTLTEVRRWDVGRLRPGSKYADRYPDYVPADGATIPTLDEAVAFIVGRAPPDFELWIELKLDPDQPALSSDSAELTAAVLDVIRRYDIAARTTLISFYWPALYSAQSWMPAVRTGYLSAERSWLNNIQRARPGLSPWTEPADIDDHAGSIPTMIQNMGGRVWSVYWRDLSPARLEDAHERGLTVGVWTIRTPDEGRAVRAMQVDVITTDRPDWFR